MTLVMKSIRSLGLWLSVCFPSHALLLLAILLLPALGHASATFVWVPNDGSLSSGTLTIDAPDSGYFSLPQTAVTSFDFTFGPGLSVI